MSRKRKKPLACSATDIEQGDQGKQQQFMKETSVGDITTGQGRRYRSQLLEEEGSAIEAIPQDANHSSPNPKAQKHRDEPQKFWNNVLGTDGIKVNSYQSD